MATAWVTAEVAIGEVVEAEVVALGMEAGMVGATGARAGEAGEAPRAVEEAAGTDDALALVLWTSKTQEITRSIGGTLRRT